MADVHTLVESTFDAPSSPVVGQSLRGVQALGRQARHQGDGFGGVLAEVTAQPRDLFDAGKTDLLSGGGAATQHAQAECVNLPIRLGAHFPERCEKAFPIGVIPKNGLPPVTAIHHACPAVASGEGG